MKLNKLVYNINTKNKIKTLQSKYQNRNLYQLFIYTICKQPCTKKIKRRKDQFLYLINCDRLKDSLKSKILRFVINLHRKLQNDFIKSNEIELK